MNDLHSFLHIDRLSVGLSGKCKNRRRRFYAGWSFIQFCSTVHGKERTRQSSGALQCWPTTV